MDLLHADIVASSMLKKLLLSSVILGEDWEALPPERRQAIEMCPSVEDLLDLLVADALLTPYQANRIRVGKRQGLILGNYRVLGRIGVGGMGVVYKAEHLRMRRVVAIKVLTMTEGTDPQLLQRFYAEIRAIARLHHPNIVSAFDTGELQALQEDSPTLHYYVMEYVDGLDLENHVTQHGPLAPGLTCELIYQVASALAEAHHHHLVHRDIKPSNILITQQSQAKLTDFGLAKHFRNRLTQPGMILGSVDYMAPEQARDSAQVDIRADIYGLGGTLFWCLTGQTPFPAQASVAEDLLVRLRQSPPSLRAVNVKLAADLDAVVQRMMAVNPEDRFQNPQLVMRALLPFLGRGGPSDSNLRRRTGQMPVAKPTTVAGPDAQRVLVVDDEVYMRNLCRMAMESDKILCDEATNGAEALAKLTAGPIDLVLLDIDMPVLSGLEVCRQARTLPVSPNLKIIMFSGRTSADEMARLLIAGADDFISKPFSMVQLLNRIRAALRLKQAQDRSDHLSRHLLQVNSELELNLINRDSDLIQSRNALILALAKLVETRHAQTSAHLSRMQHYCRHLAEEAGQQGPYRQCIDESFIQMLECCAPLHDIGTVGLPDHILMKPGKLTPDERIQMQTHTIIGAETLQEVARTHGGSMAFLGMAIDIARHHHERFDGTGYPDHLVGCDIPLAARLVTIADVYDALRSWRSYKPALSHAAALQIMKAGSEGQFDPGLLPILDHVATRFDQVFRDLGH